MKAMRSPACALALCLAAAALAGCSTPASRIKENPALFASFPPDVQAKVQEGKIEVGFAKDMVMMSLGKPDRIYSRKTEAGESEVWSYTGYYTTREQQRVNADVRVRDSSGVYRTVRDTFWVDVDTRHEYDKMRVEFSTDGAVRAIENVQR
jgi:outer membrane protein assembly factor BamE (lipoprotein component of BamABCDE complex)